MKTLVLFVSAFVAYGAALPFPFPFPYPGASSGGSDAVHAANMVVANVEGSHTLPCSYVLSNQVLARCFLTKAQEFRDEFLRWKTKHGAQTAIVNLLYCHEKQRTNNLFSEKNYELEDMEECLTPKRMLQLLYSALSLGMKNAAKDDTRKARPFIDAVKVGSEPRWLQDSYFTEGGGETMSCSEIEGILNRNPSKYQSVGWDDAFNKLMDKADQITKSNRNCYVKQLSKRR